MVSATAPGVLAGYEQRWQQGQRDSEASAACSGPSCSRDNDVSEESALGDTIRDVTMTQPWPAPPAPVRSRNWLTATLAGVAVVLAAAALIVAFTRSGSGSDPTYTAAQKTEAQTQLCERYRLAVDAAYVETNGSDVALARISATNASVILEAAASNPALSAEYRKTALALASAYQTMTATSSRGSNDTQFNAAVDDVNVKNRALRDLCGD
jgi:hypothetical protein